MSSIVRIVIGDAFASFAKNEAVVTFSELEREIAELGSQHTLILGQGLTEPQRQRLVQLASSATGPCLQGAEPLSPRELTHKAVAAHVLCSEPVWLQGTTYRSSLLVATGTDRLCDHTTGQHVNGMLLIEATRQAGIAAIERHYARQDPRKWGFSWSRCDSRFHNFAYPVPTDILIHLPHIPDFAERQQVPLTVPIVVEQARTTVCEVLMEVTLIEASLVEKLEARRAKRVAAAVVSLATEAEPLAQPA